MCRPFLVGDLPFGSYESSPQDAVRNAVRIMKEGHMDAVKLEGAEPPAHPFMPLNRKSVHQKSCLEQKFLHARRYVACASDSYVSVCMMCEVPLQIQQNLRCASLQQP